MRTTGLSIILLALCLAACSDASVNPGTTERWKLVWEYETIQSCADPSVSFTPFSYRFFIRGTSTIRVDPNGAVVYLSSTQDEITTDGLARCPMSPTTDVSAPGILHRPVASRDTVIGGFSTRDSSGAWVGADLRVSAQYDPAVISYRRLLPLPEEQHNVDIGTGSETIDLHFASLSDTLTVEHVLPPLQENVTTRVRGSLTKLSQ